MKMKKSVVIAIMVFALLALISIPTYANITNRAWLGTTYTGIDNYYGDGTVYAYREGSTAVLAVTVQNPNASAPGRLGINITSVYVTFDWGATYTSSQMSTTSPIVLQPQESRVFTLNFTVPSVTTATNLYRHSYTIYAQYWVKNASGTNWLQGKWTLFPKDPTTSNPDFVVYSNDQADAMNLRTIVAEFPSISYQSAQAKILYNQALNETYTANMYYAAGNFGAAKTSYNNALSDLNLALSDEQSYQTMLQNLQTSLTQAQINSLNAMTSFFNGLSTMWVLFGIGWVLLSIGYIVKWLRKRPEPQPATA
jgi:hypothetical protein